MDEITPFDRRMWRAMNIPDQDIKVRGVRSLDPETGSMFVDATFECKSQSWPGKTYRGEVAFDGELETCYCECPDTAKQCKHAIRALMNLGFISPPAVFENSS